MTRPLFQNHSYSPGGWATASTLVAALGYFADIWFAARAGADVAQGAFLHAVMVLALAVLPMFVGTLCWGFRNESQRAGDIGFSIVMIAQGVGLALFAATR